jgi:phage gpG-like protein
MKTLSLLGAVAEFSAMKIELDAIEHAVIVRACQLVCEAARDAIGKEHDYWPALQPETVAERLRAGYAADQPLLRTGELKNSISWRAEGLTGLVGSDNDKAVYHELGTSSIPPRPFLVPAAQQMEHRIVDMAGRAAAAVIGGRGLHGSEFSELVHLLKHAAHDVKEMATDVLEAGENERR